MASVLRAEGLTFSYPNLAIFSGLDLELREGEVRVLLGPSGSGKTTLIHLLAGILVPDRGAVYWGEATVSRLPEEQRVRLRRDYLGLVFQHHYLLPELTALENAMLAGYLAGRPDRRRALRLLGRLGVAERSVSKPSMLSVGERQRVAVARALYSRPRLLLADEPTGALDPANARAVLDALLSLAREEGTAVLLATHDERLVRGLPGWRIEGGRLVSFGT